MSRFVLTMLTFLLTFSAFGCSNQELQRIEDASSKRAMICSSIDDLASLAPSSYTEKAQQACKAGEDLRGIAAAYAGCYEPLPSVVEPQSAAPAPTPVATPEDPPAPSPAVADGG
jgi:hypothetical protein